MAKSLKPVKDAETENHVINLYNQALKYSKAERNVHARVLLEKAATYDPTSVSPYIHAVLSEIYHELGNPDRAIEEGKKALQYDPSKKIIYYNLGLYCKDARRYDEGIEYLTKFAQTVSGDKRDTALSLVDSLIKERDKLATLPSSDNDFLDLLMAENAAHHWSKTRMPLKVYIQQQSNAKGFQPTFADTARNAFITWYQASGKKLAFSFVESEPEADINVEWTDGPLKLGDDKYDRMKAGLTTSTRRDDFLEHARIQIRTMRLGSHDAEPAVRIKETCLHEIGHALGLNGHSNNTADLMYFGNSARQLPALSKRDKATMARLYQAYPPFPMEGVDTSFPFPKPDSDFPQVSETDKNGTAGGALPNDNFASIGAGSNSNEQPAASVSDTGESKSSEGNTAQASAGGTKATSRTEYDSSTKPSANQSGWQPQTAGWQQPPQASPPPSAWPQQPPAWQQPAWAPPPPGYQPYQQGMSQQPVQPWPGNQPQWTPGPAPGWMPPNAGLQQQVTPYAPPNNWQPPPAQQSYYPPQPAYQAYPNPAAMPRWTNNGPGFPPPGQPVQGNYYRQSAGPEQTGMPQQQPNPIMQFAQQFIPPNNGTGNTNPQQQQQPNQLMQMAQQWFNQQDGQQNQQQLPQGQPNQNQPIQMLNQVMKIFQPNSNNPQQ